MLTSAESFELCPLVDGTIVVFDRRQRHRRTELERCIDALDVDAARPVLGVVAVSVPASW